MAGVRTRPFGRGIGIGVLTVALTTTGLVGVTGSTAAAAAPLNVLSISRADVAGDGAQLPSGCALWYWSYGGGCGGSLSADGRQVSFVTPDAADPADTNGNWDVYVRDTVTGTTARASLADDGSGDQAFAYDSSVSGSGRYVAFTGCCSLVPGENVPPAQTGLVVSPITAQFYDHPSDSSEFDASEIAAGPFHTGTYAALNFNPSSTANCTNAPAVGPYTQPFTDVVPQPDGSCATQAVPGAFSDGAHPSFQATFEGSVTVAAAGSYAVTVDSDDGFAIGLGSRVGGGGTPSRVSGPATATATTTARHGYAVVAGSSGAIGSATVWVQFPAAGSYPFEIDYAECCGGAAQFTVSPAPAAPSSGSTQIYVRDRDTDGDGILDEPGGTSTRLVSKYAEPGRLAGNVDASDSGAWSPQISTDGRFVAFVAAADNLPGGDGSNWYGYLHDRDPDGNGVFDEPAKELTELVTVDGDGHAVTLYGAWYCGSWYGSNCGLSVSDDGQSVAFVTPDALGASDTNGAADLYVHRRDHHDLLRLSGTTAGDPIAYGTDGGSGVVSANGRYAAYTSSSPDLPGANGNWNVYLRDRDANGNGVYDEVGDATVELVSASESAATGDSTSFDAAVSDDGTVAFLSAATNLDAAYANPSNQYQAYVRRRDGAVRVVSQSADTAGHSGVFGVGIASAAPVVSFTTDYTDLVQDDTNNQPDLFLADFGTTASAVTATLSSSASSTLPGATSVAISDIPTETRKAFGLDVSTAPGGTRLRPGGTRLRPGGTRLRPGGTRLRPGGTRLRDVGDVTFASVAPRLAQSGPAREAPLSQLQVSTTGGWPELLAGTVFAEVPIQSVTIGDLLDLLSAGVAPGSPLAELRLGDLDVNDSPFAAITPAGFELGTTPVRELVTSTGAAWCDAFASETGKTCDDIGVPPGSGRSLMELDLDANAALLLAEHPDLRRPPLGPNLPALRAADAPITHARLDDLNLGVTRIGDLGLAAAIAVPGSDVGAVSLDSLTAPERALVADCSLAGFTCTGHTFVEALLAGALRPGVSLADAGRHYGAVTVADLGADLLGPIEVNDVVTGALDASDFPWEDLDLATAGVQEYSDDVHTVDETLTVRVASTDSNPVAADVQMQLPAGFRLDPRVRGGVDPVLLDGPPGALATLASTSYDDVASRLRWTVTGLTPNVDYQLRVRVLPGLQVGSGQVTARVWSAGRRGLASPQGIAVVEPPDAGATTATAGTVTADRLFFGYLPGGTDVDLFHFSPRTSDSEVGVRLSHLAGDADLVLYGPPTDATNAGPSSAPSRAIAPQVAPIEDEGLDPTGNQVAARPEVSADVPVDPPTGDAVVGKSATSASVEEELADGTGADYVQVSTYNGSSSSLPYVLHVHEVSPTPVPACQPYTHPLTGLAGTMPNLAALPSDLATVILVDQQRLGDQYPAADVNALLAKLQTLAADPSVKGVVVPVDGSDPSRPGLSGFPDIAGAYAQLNADTCNPDAANRVVDRITQLVRGIRSGTLPGVGVHSQLANVVVVGSDSVIPMARVTDTTRSGNESQYADAFDAGSPIGAALSSDHFLTDAPFGDLDPVPWLNRRLYVEDLAVGRLVESPQEIGAVVDTYLAPTNGRALDPTKAFVAGYDWMKSGASAVGATLGSRLTEANGGNTVTPGQLVTDGWTSDNLLTGAGSVAAAQSRITGVYMHADHGTGVAADGSLFAPSQLAAALPTGSKLVFSMGCHSGIDDPALADTFPAMMNGAGATYLASTGFGYGDDSGVQLHDRLVNYFADELNGSVSIGQALTRAKQRYFSSQGLYGAYDDKVLETMTLYGLPMFRIGTGTGAAPTPPDVVPTAGTGGVSAASFAYDTSAPGAVDVPMAGALVPHTGADGRWYEVAGSLPLALPGRPVQPRVDHDVTARSAGSLLPAHGALITSLTEPSPPENGFDAAWSRATIDTAADEPELVAGEVAFPARLATVATYSDPTGAPLGAAGPPQRQRLVVTPGRFESSGDRDVNGTGTQELFSRVAGSVLYSSSGDYSEPDVRNSSATVDPVQNTAEFAVDATDASGITRVVVLFRDDTGWKRIDLDPAGGDHWAQSTAVVSAASAVPYFVQVVDGNGNVGVASNKGALFDAGVRPSVSISDVSVAEPLQGRAPATFTVTLSKRTSVPVQVDWATHDGSASSLADYTAGAGTLVFAPGDTTKTVSVDVLADQENEPDEAFTVDLTNAVGAAVAAGSGTATIAGSSSTTVSVGSASVSEGDVKNGGIRFQVALSSPATQPITIRAATVSDTATGGAKLTDPATDFKPVNRILTFKPGQVAIAVTVPVRADTAPESDETFRLELSEPTNVAVRSGTGIGTILDDDHATGARLASGDVRVVEGNAKQRTAIFTVRFASPVTALTTVNWTLVGQSATGGPKAKTPGADFVLKSGVMTFKEKSFTKTVAVVLLPDSTPGEHDETLRLHLSGPSSDQFLRADGTLTIVDDD